MMAKKQKLTHNSTAYKHFHSTSQSKRRNGKNRKKYFEHDTRTQTIRSIVNPISAPTSATAIASAPTPIKKIKFNNEINIYETTNAGGNLDPKSKSSINRKKFRNRRISNLKIQTTTTKLQKQLIETQKKLQKQLLALQTHQHQQNHSFLAFIRRSNCIQMPINDDSHSNKINNDDADDYGHEHVHRSFNSISKHLDCSDIICKHFQTLDQNKCLANDKITEKGNNTTAIRPKIACDPKNCITSADRRSTDLCYCIGAKSSLVPSIDKRSKLNLKRPLLKSIVRNKETEKPVKNIKQEPFHSDYPELNKVSDECLADKTNMQFDKKQNKQINSYFKINDTDNGRSYSPPLPKSSRITSSLSNNSQQMASASTEAKEVRTNRDKKSNKKKKRRRRSYSKSSRSRSRSRSFSRRSRRASSSSRSPSPSRSSKHRDRRSSKRDDCTCNCRYSNSCRKSSKKERNSSKRSNSKINSKSPSNDRDQSINFNSINSSYAFNSKSNSLSTQCDANKKKVLGVSVDAKSNGVAFKKKLITLNTGILLKQQPIVRLQSSPGSGSDSDNEIDDRFDKKYEELLTFETHEDERREQRLLKALSDIAAKAKQKIQSITDTSMAKNNSDKNHNERSVPKTTKIAKQENVRRLHESRDDRNSDRKDTDAEDDHEYSPQNKKHTSRRSRHESTSSSSKEDERSPRSSRSPSIPRRRGSPSFLDRRRITSARKKPIPYQRSSPYDSYDEWDSS